MDEAQGRKPPSLWLGRASSYLKQLDFFMTIYIYRVTVALRCCLFSVERALLCHVTKSRVMVWLNSAPDLAVPYTPVLCKIRKYCMIFTSTSDPDMNRVWNRAQSGLWIRFPIVNSHLDPDRLKWPIKKKKKWRNSCCDLPDVFL